MDKAQLEYYLDQGLSLPQIGVLTGRDASSNVSRKLECRAFGEPGWSATATE